MSETPFPTPTASAGEPPSSGGRQPAGEHQPTGVRRSTDLTLARLHLRLGSLALARSELETLAGRGGLDDEALVDLAEARWRTGDGVLAGEAATSALDRGHDTPLAVMIAAEAAFALGRPGEARRLATRAMSAAGGTLDALFAGMPRSSVWPADPADPAPSATTLFGEDRADAPAGAAGATGVAGVGEEGAADGSAAQDATVVAAVLDDAAAPGLWDAEEATPEVPAPSDPATLMEQGMAALGAGDEDRAAALLGLAIRMGPHLAPVILDATIDATDANLLLVRGDAFRSTGHESDAVATFAAAARTLSDDIADVRPDPADAGTAIQSGLTSHTPQ